MDQTRIQKLTDYTSLFFAGVCAVHCFAVPVALILFPVVGSTVAFEFEEIFHELMLFAVIPVSTIAVLLGCRRHKDLRVIVLVVLGLCFILVGIFAATDYMEYVLAFIGAFIMILGHLRNFKLCRKDGSCDH
ncbi:MAG: MerC domain-containing protein [Candidatus Dadabacteria bacterium]|nr:MerC domain-containing protein [Candidatus Dadabacteria bacterium]